MKLSITLTIALFISSLAMAQEVVSSGGDYHSNSSGSLSSTIGEPIIETFSAGDYTLTQGFQQTKLIITALKPHEAAKFNLEIFPNPTHSTIIIEATEEIQQSLQYSLYDFNGKVLYETCSDQSILKIDLTSFSPGTYLLRISNDNQQMNTYKIIKN